MPFEDELEPGANPSDPRATVGLRIATREARPPEWLDARSLPMAGGTLPSIKPLLGLIGRGLRIFVGVFGVFLAVASSFFAAFAIDELLKSSERAQFGAALLLAFLASSAAVVTAGALMIRWSFGSTRAMGALERDRAILVLAASSGGHLTVAEVVMKIGLSIEQSQLALQRLSRQGLAEMLVSDDGMLGYGFTGLVSPDKKTAAGDEP